jgi:FtsP/CotA-like multicopper oxidase with cupredoxin domain
VTWDYAPQNRNVAMGKAFGADEAPWVVRGPHKIGKEFTKALYREYTDETFTTLKPRPKQWEHLGYLGPLVRAEVGDTIKIVFKNNLTFPASLHPHGVFYEKASEGAPYGDGVEPAKKSAAPRGGTQTYTWPVPERAGPTEHEMNSVLWMYHSHVSEVADANAGLMGPMIITGRGRASPTARRPTSTASSSSRSRSSAKRRVPTSSRTSTSTPAIPRASRSSWTPSRRRCSRRRTRATSATSSCASR